MPAAAGISSHRSGVRATSEDACAESGVASFCSARVIGEGIASAIAIDNTKLSARRKREFRHRCTKKRPSSYCRRAFSGNFFEVRYYAYHEYMLSAELEENALELSEDTLWSGGGSALPSLSVGGGGG